MSDLDDILNKESNPVKKKEGPIPPKPEIGRMSPQATDLEEAILGAIMLEKQAIQIVNDILKLDHFYKDSNRIVYEVCLSMYDSGEPIDILTVTEKLRETGKLEKVGGAFYLTELTSSVNSAANIEYHARIVQEKGIKRNLIQASNNIIRNAYDDTTDVFDLIDNMESTIMDIVDVSTSKTAVSLRESIGEEMNSLAKRMNSDRNLIGLSSGFKSLDDIVLGWRAPDLIIIGARPGMGKSVLGLNFLRNAAMIENVSTAYFSLEMSHTQLSGRILSAESEVDSYKMKKGTISKDEYNLIQSKISNLVNKKIFIDDTAALKIREFKAKARRLKQQHDVKLIVVDYLQLMQGSGKRGQNRENEISEISQGLKATAKELNIPIIAFSQLSRAVESRGGDKRPKLSDLRESGSLEQDADIVMLLYRPEYYGFTEITDIYGNPVPSKGLAEIEIAKHRDGSLEKAYLKFIGRFMKFSDWEDFGGSLPEPKKEIPSI